MQFWANTQTKNIRNVEVQSIFSKGLCYIRSGSGTKNEVKQAAQEKSLHLGLGGITAPETPQGLPRASIQQMGVKRGRCQAKGQWIQAGPLSLLPLLPRCATEFI